jgi:hypothetical protein
MSRRRRTLTQARGYRPVYRYVANLTFVHESQALSSRPEVVGSQ